MPKTDGPSLTTQSTQLSATTLTVQTSYSANIASSTVQTIDQSVGSPVTNSDLETMLFQAGGPSTITNTVTTHACNSASDDPASMSNTILSLSPIPTLSWRRPRTRKTVSNHLNIFSFQAPFEKATGSQGKEYRERPVMMQIPKAMARCIEEKLAHSGPSGGYQSAYGRGHATDIFSLEKCTVTLLRLFIRDP
ncbi:hypothetical protein LSH36_811g01024 [Paralvinella palmiformis]|uniref:Uncharacterized protein n=1 Tax=Paralvinella palmiformis TaxID=53620 RepID=A0AAD9J046_9ANNE|nr:hypothetical protein LSH36_811g01024 [Paralvinella palmiformis]